MPPTRLAIRSRITYLDSTVHTILAERDRRQTHAADLRQRMATYRAASARRAPVGALTAAAAPIEPPAAWFANPGLRAPTPLTVTAEGRVYGHLAAWDTCHTGMSGRCVTPPRSTSSYSQFRTGAVLTAEGTEVPVGHLTAGTGHAPVEASIPVGDVVSHYDHTGYVVADVAAGEDEVGIWLAGALRPDASPEQIRTLRASPLSGDWRALGGKLELVAALAVNTPGFPIPRQLVAHGAPVALIAPGPRRATGAGMAATRPILTAATMRARIDAGRRAVGDPEGNARLADMHVRLAHIALDRGDAARATHSALKAMNWRHDPARAVRAASNRAGTR
ncbi:hypothetical protein [Pseudofrankia sp. BMG5.37]|uniref:hypothetical protein n=1 Tax=Pseudofrankia sp. BMG5.37 TaxID=3050035 RepID=UPI002893A58B|nr:hypothetical protein [Pseudofrankia sp. BMG5.37]MDT3438350.1 hypothetical protein [Pseudofrankia sp. BMG5.37]